MRTERRPGSRYASLAQCAYELRQAEQLYRRIGVPYVNSANMSIEEIAAAAENSLPRLEKDFGVVLEHTYRRVESVIDLPPRIPTPANLRFRRAMKAAARFRPNRRTRSSCT